MLTPWPGAGVEVVWPDLIPCDARNATVWPETQLRQMAVRVPRTRCISVVAGTGAVTVSGRARAMKSLGEGASMERKVALLLQRDRETQQAENALAARLHGLERDISTQLRKLRTGLRDHFANTLTETLSRCRSLRMLGPFSAPSESPARFSRVSLGREHRVEAGPAAGSGSKHGAGKTLAGE